MTLTLTPELMKVIGNALLAFLIGQAIGAVIFLFFAKPLTRWVLSWFD